nr:hypothetical protein [Tanacetum cinerariifolium]
LGDSPKAPTASPLSDGHTPGYGRGHTPTNVATTQSWAAVPVQNVGSQTNPLQPRMNAHAVQERPPGASFSYTNPPLPQMGGGNGLG